MRDGEPRSHPAVGFRAAVGSIMRIDDECAMNTGRLGSALVACLALLTVSCVPFAKALNRLPPQQTVHEGRPALRYDAEKGWFTIVDLVERDGEPMFRFRVAHHHGGAWGDATRRCRGFLLLSPTRIIFDPVLGPESAATSLSRHRGITSVCNSLPRPSTFSPSTRWGGNTR
jgi:hypothetical protein